MDTLTRDTGTSARVLTLDSQNARCCAPCLPRGSIRFHEIPNLLRSSRLDQVLLDVVNDVSHIRIASSPATHGRHGADRAMGEIVAKRGVRENEVVRRRGRLALFRFWLGLCIGGLFASPFFGGLRVAHQQYGRQNPKKHRCHPKRDDDACRRPGRINDTRRQPIHLTDDEPQGVKTDNCPVPAEKGAGSHPFGGFTFAVVPDVDVGKGRSMPDRDFAIHARHDPDRPTGHTYNAVIHGIGAEPQCSNSRQEDRGGNGEVRQCFLQNFSNQVTPLTRERPNRLILRRSTTDRLYTFRTKSDALTVPFELGWRRGVNIQVPEHLDDAPANFHKFCRRLT